MKTYTKIPNEIFEKSQLSIQARYLYCVLLKYCGKDEWCYPSQLTLAKQIGCTDRTVREYLSELKNAGLVIIVRKGWNRSNSYQLSKNLVTERNSNSSHIGSQIPLHTGNTTPTKSTYIKGKDKRSIKGREQLRQKIYDLRLKRNSLVKSIDMP